MRLRRPHGHGGRGPSPVGGSTLVEASCLHRVFFVDNFFDCSEGTHQLQAARSYHHLSAACMVVVRGDRFFSRCTSTRRSLPTHTRTHIPGFFGQQIVLTPSRVGIFIHIISSLLVGLLGAAAVLVVLLVLQIMVWVDWQVERGWPKPYGRGRV